MYPNAAILDPTETFSDPEAQWPVIFHSHGLSGARTTYRYCDVIIGLAVRRTNSLTAFDVSHLCVRIASEGNVVVAIEHRDGTAPVVTSHFAATPSTSAQGKKPKPKVKYYLHPEDVMYGGHLHCSTILVATDMHISYDDGSEAPHLKFRAEQLLFRELEIYLAYRGLADLVNSHPRAEAGKCGCNELFTVRLNDLNQIKSSLEAFTTSKDTWLMSCPGKIRSGRAGLLAASSYERTSVSWVTHSAGHWWYALPPPFENVPVNQWDGSSLSYLTLPQLSPPASAANASKPSPSHTH